MAHEAEEAAAAGIARVVMLLSLAAFASAVALRLCDPLLPELARSFDTTTARAAMVITATSIAYGICQLLFGPLGDRFGKFPVIAWACLASTLGALACAAAPTLDSLSLARAMTGATTAALIPLSMAWIGDVVAFDERQHTLAKFMSGQIIGMVSGQAVGGLFADTIGWRWAFVFLAAIYCVVGLLLLRALKRLQQRGTLADPGAADQAGTLARITMILGSAKARGILMTVFIEAMAAFGVMAFIPAYLHERFGLSLFHAGSVVAVFGAGGLLYTSFARRWVRALGEARLALLGGGLAGNRLSHAVARRYLVLGRGGLPAGRSGFLSTAQHAADPGHADGAGRPRHGGLAFRFVLFSGPGGRCQPRRLGDRTLRRALAVRQFGADPTAVGLAFFAATGKALTRPSAPAGLRRRRPASGKCRHAPRSGRNVAAEPPARRRSAGRRRWPA